MGQARRRQAEIAALKAQTSKPGHVYVMGTRERRHLIKIGCANDPERRRRELQTGSPDRLRIYWESPVNDMLAVERWLQRHFRRMSIPGGEWLDISPADVRDMESLLTLIMFELLATEGEREEVLGGTTRQITDLIDDPGLWASSARRSQEVRSRFGDCSCEKCL